MHRRTVRRYLAGPVPLRNRAPERPRPSGLSSPTLQSFVDYLQVDGKPGAPMWRNSNRELEAQGYQGSYPLPMQALAAWRGPRPPPEPGRGRRRGRPRIKRVNVRWLCLRPPDQVDQNEREALHEHLADDEHVTAGYELHRRFRRLIVRRTLRDLNEWLEDAASSGLRPFAGLAAVVNGLTLPWSTRPVEGTVSRVKSVSSDNLDQRASLRRRQQRTELHDEVVS
jgi:transposase